MYIDDINLLVSADYGNRFNQVFPFVKTFKGNVESFDDIKRHISANRINQADVYMFVIGVNPENGLISQFVPGRDKALGVLYVYKSDIKEILGANKLGKESFAVSKLMALAQLHKINRPISMAV